MEESLTRNLISLAAAFTDASGLSIATVGVKAAGDWRFFSALKEGRLNYRVRTYDRVVVWFSANWPAGVDWPSDVPRPVTPCENQEAA